VVDFVVCDSIECSCSCWFGLRLVVGLLSISSLGVLMRVVVRVICCCMLFESVFILWCIWLVRFMVSSIC